MSHTIDIGMMELLASKICHDLISPIGAVNNGIEILDEMGPDAGEEVTDLIAYSAQQASAKLQAYRMAYGAGGADKSVKPEDVHKAIETMISADGKIKQDWNPLAPIGPAERPGGFAKILVSVLLLAIESLPKGGTLSVKADGGNILVLARGPDAGLREGMEAALALSLPREKLEPKFVHAYMCGLIADHYGYKLSVGGTGEGYIGFNLTPPSS